METPIISVIVPIYNVKAYLNRCVDSILKQTYLNLQIILVDDGSIDGCAEICDKYEKIDSRVQVFHKKNGGLSDARNYGIDRAIGDYIAFVDSDDFVNERYIEKLYTNLAENDGDISILRYKRFYNEEECYQDITKNEVVNCYTAKEAIEVLLYRPEIIPQSSNAKLYKSHLFKDVRFPIGRHNEDIATTYKLFAKANIIVHSNLEYYFYFQREESIVRSNFTERTMDCVWFSEEILRFVEEKMPSVRNAAVCFALAQNIQVLLKIPINNSEYGEDLDILKKNIKRYRKVVIFDTKVTWQRRLGACSTYFGVRISKKLAKIYKQKVNHEKII